MRVDIEEVQAKTICLNCTTNQFLSQVIELEGDIGKCSYCRRKAKNVLLERLTVIVDEAFSEHYSITPSEPDAYESMRNSDPEDDYEWERSGDTFVWLIQDLAGISEKIACDMQTLLQDLKDNFDDDETPYDEDCRYELNPYHDEEVDFQFLRFQDSIISGFRFFNPYLADLLRLAFKDVADLRTKSNTPVVVECGSGGEISSLYRARVFQSRSKIMDALSEPEVQLGPPPSEQARAGRMNAFGVSVFYGATSREAARNEVRPPIGSTLLIGEFSIVRKLRLLDLEALLEVYVEESIFDPTYFETRKQAYIVKKLSEYMARAVLPNDEGFEYVPTQAIADYLAIDRSLRIDGIIYPSVQSAGKGSNVVLFHNSSRVHVPKKSEREIDVRLDDSDGEDYREAYSISERLKYRKNSYRRDAINYEGDYVPFSDQRSVTLSLNLETIVAERVASIAYLTRQIPFEHHRFEMDSSRTNGNMEIFDNPSENL